MAHAQQSIDSLPLWQTFNSITFAKTQIADIPGKGSGLVAVDSTSQSPSAKPGSDIEAGASHGPISPLISVPEGLVLHAEAVEDYAKQDRNFRLLLDAAGHQSTRGDVLLFLMVQLVIGSRQPGEDLACLPTPWTDYVRFLPADVPLPTMWTDEERLLLRGTSLEVAVQAKLLALENEFDQLRERSSDIPYWDAAFWERKFPLELQHWILVDSWYRSRCLELPRFGPSMVPSIDMVNHSSTPNAYYEDRTAIPAARDDAGVVLLLRPGQQIAAGDEITISYTGGKGNNAPARLTSAGDTSGSQDGFKPASEMLFSYGFIDPESIRHSLVLPVQPFPDDPLSKAKLHVFGAPAPRLEIEQLQVDGEEVVSDGHASNKVRWMCPFLYLMCVNEEDGLDFRLRQETDGSTQLRMFWQDNDVTDMARDFETLTSTHELAPIFRLRVVTVLQEVIESHLERMRSVGSDVDVDGDDGSDEDVKDKQARDETDMTDDGDGHHDDIRGIVAEQAAILRDVESRVLSGALETLEAEVSFTSMTRSC
ncbi:hypothetical protein SEUCBS140593_000094 [Sporothrix eucalyptigena]|uniref:SET domain-containing protein n=1 Tax=Sporothrix eucalyptigena TaxID=1812306 RepID=A0ABP0AMV4_9PEZI